jgi:hypothetical protein
MAEKIAVVPTRAGLKLVHPIDGALPDDGGNWTRDQFTFALLREGSILKRDVAATNAGAMPKPEIKPAK